MIIKKILYLPLCKYLRPCALFCAFVLISSLKITALMIDTLFYNIPFSVPVHPLKIFRIAMIFSQNISKCIPTNMRWTRDVECLSPPKFPHSACCVESPIFYILYLFKSTLIHPFSSPRSLVPGFIVPVSIVQYQQTVHWKRQKIAGISTKFILVDLQSIQSEA